MRPGWTKRDGTTTEAYDYAAAAKNSAYVSVYEDRQDCYYQVVRGTAEHSGIKSTLELAMIESEHLLALPENEFKAVAVADLIAELKRLQLRIARIDAETEALAGYGTGYNTGYKDGQESIKQLIAEALA